MAADLKIEMCMLFYYLLQSGFEILKQMLADEAVLSHLPLADIWEWQVGVACRQTGTQRLKAIHLLLRLLQCQSQT